MIDGEAKFKVGDQVKIINYGHLMWGRYKKVDGEYKHSPETWDMQPKIIGQIGVISQVKITQDTAGYVIDGIPNKSAWYEDGQLELVHRPEYK